MSTDVKKPAQQQTPSVQSSKPPPTEGDKIWDEIKNKEVFMFAIPNQIVSDYCEPKPLDPTKCFLSFKVSSFLPALEEAIGANKPESKYNCELHGNFIVVSRN